MKKLFLIVIAMVLVSGVSGCGKYNPCAPDLHGQHVDGPPVLYLSFDDTVKNLSTWSAALTWWNDLGATWNGYGVGWHPNDPGAVTDANGVVDHARSLAYNFWLTKKDKSIGGICGNFAGFFIYCCRMSGYKTGGIVYYWQDEQGKVTGHIEAFVRDTDGKVITTSNAVISHYKTFNSLAEMRAHYDSNWNKKNSYCFYVDDHCNEIPKEKLQDYFGN